MKGIIFSSFCAEKVVSHVKQESKFKMPYFFFVKQFSQQIPLYVYMYITSFLLPTRMKFVLEKNFTSNLHWKDFNFTAKVKLGLKCNYTL